MKINNPMKVVFVCALGLALAISVSVAADKEAKSVLEFTMKDIDGKEVPLSEYKGDVLLVVNVASQCGLTPQYEGLETIYERYKDKGFAILGFPANNFGAQEPGTESEIKGFCTSKYKVTFPMFSKVSVKGEDQCDLYKYLTSTEKHGEAIGGEVQWNFQKYLVDRKGNLVARFNPKVKPMDPDVVSAIEKALDEPKG